MSFANRCLSFIFCVYVRCAVLLSDPHSGGAVGHASSDGKSEAGADSDALVQGSKAFHSLALLWGELLRCSWAPLASPALAAFAVASPASGAAAKTEAKTSPATTSTSTTSASTASQLPTAFGAGEWLLFLKLMEIHTREAPAPAASGSSAAPALAAIADQCVALAQTLVVTVFPPLEQYLQTVQSQLSAAAAASAPTAAAASPSASSTAATISAKHTEHSADAVHPLLVTAHFMMQTIGT
jgi:hypothetical protein